MNMRSNWLTALFLAACLVFATTLSVKTRNDLYPGGKRDTTNPNLDLIEGEVNLRRTAPLNSSCTNQPSSRQCWYGDFDVLTDVDETWPSTGKTIYVRWIIGNLT